ncbi:MAG TPA: tripartite tricarboxylate transporter substrate binding protein [Burkholderiales bacterium]|jgi:tripartite-type tricarboxylate transporter receptor subunit TctC|nr:tripartite tricarboxylate transporter substrate binding protein [Burkholderiales bacterium]
MNPVSIEAILSTITLVFCAGTASGQNYPSKPIRMLTAEAGGGADFVARVIARELSANLGEQVVVDNRGGAGGIIAGEIVARAAPDGYTLLFYGPAIWLLPFLRNHVPYDPVRDFSPITMAVTTPNILVVHPSLPVSSVGELIALAKARPGQINDAGANTGSSVHLAAELFKAMAGVKIVRVPFKGVGPALNALIAGQVQIMFPSAGAVAPHVKSGRLRALAVTSAQPTALAPGLPTVAASGVPGYESIAMFGIFAPARLPAALSNRLHQEIVRALLRPEVKSRLFESGVEPVGSAPAEFAATLKSEMTKWGKVIKDAGIRDE